MQGKFQVSLDPIIGKMKEAAKGADEVLRSRGATDSVALVIMTCKIYEEGERLEERQKTLGKGAGIEGI